MEKLTFKQYLESKEQLLKAVEKNPVSLVEYEIKKYCSLTFGNGTAISFKPKQKLVVEWKYDDIYYPTPIIVEHTGKSDYNESPSNINIPNIALQKFLSRNTIIKRTNEYT